MAMKLDELNNLKLEQLITTDRQRYSLSVASAEQMAALAGHVDRAVPPKATIDQWWIVRFDDHKGGWASHHLLSDTWITSQVEVVDHEGCRVRTRNSIYAIGQEAEGEPGLSALMYLCAWLWDVGAGVTLGVPRAWF